MAANLKRSPLKGKNNMSKTKRATRNGATNRPPRRIQTLAPREALQLLASAFAYCQQAGLTVNAANGEDETLVLFIPRARYVVTANGGAAFVLNENAPTRPMGDAAI
jgi:hypothetical protein